MPQRFFAHIKRHIYKMHLGVSFPVLGGVCDCRLRRPNAVLLRRAALAKKQNAFCRTRLLIVVGSHPTNVDYLGVCGFYEM